MGLGAKKVNIRYYKFQIIIEFMKKCIHIKKHILNKIYIILFIIVS